MIDINNLPYLFLLPKYVGTVQKTAVDIKYLGSYVDIYIMFYDIYKLFIYGCDNSRYTAV